MSTGFGYAPEGDTGVWYGGYRVGGDQTADGSPSTDPQVVDAPQLDFGQWSGPVDEYGQPTGDQSGQSADQYGQYDPNGNLYGSAQDASGSGSLNAYDQYATEFQSPSSPAFGTSDHIYTNESFPSGGGNEPAAYQTARMGGGNLNSPMYSYGTPISSLGGTGTSVGQKSSSGGGSKSQAGVQTPAPRMEAPTPFGSPNFRGYATAGDQGQPATGSLDTVFFMNKLKELISNPGQISSNPGYQFAMDQGMNAMNRTAAAKRGRFAGGALLEAQKFGQGLAGTQYNNIANILSTALGRATNQYGQDISRYGLEQGLIGNLGANNYTAWQNRQANAGAEQANQVLQELAAKLGL